MHIHEKRRKRFCTTLFFRILNCLETCQLHYLFVILQLAYKERLCMVKSSLVKSFIHNLPSTFSFTTNTRNLICLLTSVCRAWFIYKCLSLSVVANELFKSTLDAFCIDQYSKYIAQLNKDIAYKLELGVTMNIQYAVQISKRRTLERKIFSLQYFHT